MSQLAGKLASRSAPRNGSIGAAMHAMARSPLHEHLLDAEEAQPPPRALDLVDQGPVIVLVPLVLVAISLCLVVFHSLSNRAFLAERRDMATGEP